MKKIKILIWIIIILIVLSMVFFSNSLLNNHSESYDKFNINNAEVDDIGVSDDKTQEDVGNKFISDIEKSSEYKNCVSRDIDNYSCLLNQINDKITEVKDVEKCDNLIDGVYVKECKDFNLEKIALKNKDISICDKVSGENNNCKLKVSWRVSVENNDLSYCESLSSDFKRVDCVNTASAMIARKTLDIKHCSKIVNENARKNCVSEINFLKKNGDNGM